MSPEDVWRKQWRTSPLSLTAMRNRAGSGASRPAELNFSSGVCGAMNESSSGEKRILVAIGLMTNWVAVTGFSTALGDARWEFAKLAALAACLSRPVGDRDRKERAGSSA